MEAWNFTAENDRKSVASIVYNCSFVDECQNPSSAQRREEIPNENDSIGGMANRFLGTVGGETLTETLDILAGAATEAQKGAVGYLNYMSLGLNGTGGIDPSDPSFSIGEDVGFATNIALIFAGGSQSASKALSSSEQLLFARGTGLLNSNNYIRIGYGWKGSATAGKEVFRIAIGNKNSWIHLHFP